MDIYSKEKRSEIMSKIKGKDTQLEKKGWAMLRKAGVNFRIHPKDILGKPDAGNKRKKVAVFFDSEFWHGYDWKNHKKDFKSNKKFWIPKIERNIDRDKKVSRELKKRDWKVIRIWERDLNKSKVINTIKMIREEWH